MTGGVHMPASTECLNCGTPLWMCGDPYCCNHCDHAPKLASGKPAFGQIWRYRVGGQGGLWMLVAPKADDIDLGYWYVLYMGRDLIETRIRTGRTVIDQMAGIPGAAKEYVDAGWERVS